MGWPGDQGVEQAGDLLAAATRLAARTDLSAWRIELIGPVSVAQGGGGAAWRDALVYREQLEGMMDVVLIDAPCTGSGVMDEKPDLKVRLNAQDLRSLVETQQKMLDTCSRYVKPGGLLVYATCSILPDENDRQTEAFLLTHPEFSIQALPETIPQSLRQYEGPLGLQLLPHRDNTEGFYIARMRRA